MFGFEPAQLITRLVVVLVAMSVHEFAHSYVAFLAGDPTAAHEGRLTLNPFVHINWVGFIMFVVIGFGILGSAPVNPNRMRNPRWGYLAAVAAGPFSNLLLAIIFALPIRAGLLPLDNQSIAPVFLPTLDDLVAAMIFWNVLLFLFNLLPFAPLDGWTIVRQLLPTPARKTWDAQRQTSQYIFFGLLIMAFIGIFNFFSILIARPAFAIMDLLVGMS